MMPFRASRSDPPADVPLVIAGLFPSSVMSWMVTSFACVRMMLLPPAHSEPPPAPPQFGLVTAGITVVDACPAPASVSALPIVTFSVYVPAATFTVPLADTWLMPPWIVFLGLVGVPPSKASLPVVAFT